MLQLPPVYELIPSIQANRESDHSTNLNTKPRSKYHHSTNSLQEKVSPETYFTNSGQPDYFLLHRQSITSLSSVSPMDKAKEDLDGRRHDTKLPSLPSLILNTRSNSQGSIYLPRVQYQQAASQSAHLHNSVARNLTIQSGQSDLVQPSQVQALQQ